LRQQSLEQSKHHHRQAEAAALQCQQLAARIKDLTASNATLVPLCESLQSRVRSAEQQARDAEQRAEAAESTAASEREALHKLYADKLEQLIVIHNSDKVHHDLQLQHAMAEHAADKQRFESQHAALLAKHQADLQALKLEMCQVHDAKVAERVARASLSEQQQQQAGGNSVATSPASTYNEAQAQSPDHHRNQQAMTYDTLQESCADQQVLLVPNSASQDGTARKRKFPPIACVFYDGMQLQCLQSIDYALMPVHTIDRVGWRLLDSLPLPQWWWW
jgi:hypothetical protein